MAIDTIGPLLSSLLGLLERVVWVQRHLHPPLAARLAEPLAAGAEPLRPALGHTEAAAWPDDLVFLRDQLIDVTRQTLEMTEAFVEAAQGGGDPFELYRALRRFSRVQEALYPLAPVLEAVSRWFLEPARRTDEALVERLRAGTLREGGPRTGLLHADNERNERGGFSLYVPESWDGAAAMPLVVALHGGSGHGRDFVWSWLREARARQALLLSPTSTQRTWSLMGDDVDSAPLRQMVEGVAERYPVDRTRVLLTGMSDGGTYTMICGLQDDTTFTHLAPACGVLHLGLLGGGLERARDKPIYLIHGALDWMFPVYTARMAQEALIAVGARLVYRELPDLSHTYPRDENPRILDWLTG
ncbi:MAG TPA: phospholipase [Methylomirabilota bacterium]|jgi:phospholipase/carboxylesterase|nr:phospholipase [Methylomirabilota bacterium]